MKTAPKGYIEIEKYQLLEKENHELRIRIASIEHELNNLKRMIFGSKSDTKFISNKLK